MARMLSLYFQIKEDAESQVLAATVADGFGYETWKALQEAGTVYEARITSLRHPDRPEVYSHILLATTYEGLPRPYQQFFWNRITLFFVLVAFAAKRNPPFSKADLTEQELVALGGALEALTVVKAAKTQEEFDIAQETFGRANRALANALSLDPTKFEEFVRWVNENDLTYNVGSPPAPPNVEGVDFRVPPGIGQSRNFLNPAIKPGPFPAN